MDPTVGRLLVASPLIGDPNFHRSVVLMIEHTAQGALGVALNNPSETLVADMLPAWKTLASRPAAFFLGGPVSPEAVIGLGRVLGGAEETFHPVVQNVGTVDLNRAPGELDLELEEVRIFSGYSGWGPRQLDSELRADAWFVVDADPHDVFITEPEELWSFVLARQSGPMAWLANYPVNPKLN